MKINCVTSYKSSINLNKSQINRNQHVSFGFGEDFGINPFVDPEPNNEAPNPSLLNCIKYGVKLPFIICGEIFGKKEKQRLADIERLGRQAEAQERKDRENGIFEDD